MSNVASQPGTPATSPQPVWVPDTETIAGARLTHFAAAVTARTGLDFGGYHDLQRWSASEPAQFWAAVWDYFAIEHTGDPQIVMESRGMPGARWFPEVHLNYVDQVARWGAQRGDAVAITYLGEDGTRRDLSWNEMLRRAGALALWLRAHGVRPGDRVAGYLPNIPEAVIAFLATASVGAIWAACGQDYSATAAIDRLGQLAPTVLITANGYRYADKVHDRSPEVAALRKGIDSIERVLVVDNLRSGVCPPGSVDWAGATAGDGRLDSVRVPFDHPLWTVFSSGTTGKPKGIVHGHGGVLLEHLKTVALQLEIGEDSTFWWYTSPSWMMWNLQIAGLLVGARIVCADGSPSHPRPDALFALAAQAGVTDLGTSPGYVQSCLRAVDDLAGVHDLSALRSVGVTGSAMPATTMRQLTTSLGGDIPVFSMSGGTDVVSAFAVGVRVLPVWAGEISAPALGVALNAFDGQGRPVHGSVGELVVTQPMPSMPICFWDDPDGARYTAAYFSVYPGVWRHGDWITLTDRGTVVVHGRSDSTLNRNGVRMGSADIYQVTDQLPQVRESLVVGVELDDGRYWMPLFVVPADGYELDETLVATIAGEIRQHASPRHVPDDIIAAPAIPHTRTGKKLEVPIKRILQGAAPLDVVDPNSVDCPEVLDWYARHRIDTDR